MFEGLFFLVIMPNESREIINTLVKIVKKIKKLMNTLFFL